MRRSALAACAALAACGAPDERSDWEREHVSRLVADPASVLPPYPKAGLVEFEVAPRGGFRYYLDPGSLSVAADGAVRYTLVARSPAGAETVSYEALRCRSAEVRVYAAGLDGRWSGRPGPWQRLAQRWHKALYEDYFCPQGRPIASAGEGVDALRRGGHPLARDFSSDMPRGR